MIYPNIVILNFDLGIRANYDDLYRFLDSYEAMDCGNSNAVFLYPFKGEDLSYEDKFEQIKKEIEKTVQFGRNDRIYVIVHSNEGVGKGKFLFGQRKTPIWDGYAIKEEDDDLPF